MSRVRVIARLDIKGKNLIKGIHLEGLRVLGDPNKFALKYYQEGIDEIIYIDSVASLYGRNSLTEFIHASAKNVFIPMTVGGGIRSLEDVKSILRAGADKVAINTWATKVPDFLKEVANKFGSSCTVLSIEAKKKNDGTWEAYTDNGREQTGLNVVDWARRAVDLGVGEILLTSIDQEGTKKGFDLDLVKAVSDVVSVPVIASGGMGKIEDFVNVVKNAGADAVAIASVLHYEKINLPELKEYAAAAGLDVRRTGRK